MSLKITCLEGDIQFHLRQLWSILCELEIEPQIVFDRQVYGLRHLNLRVTYSYYPTCKYSIDESGLFSQAELIITTWVDDSQVSNYNFYFAASIFEMCSYKQYRDWSISVATRIYDLERRYLGLNVMRFPMNEVRGPALFPLLPLGVTVDQALQRTQDLLCDVAVPNQSSI